VIPNERSHSILSSVPNVAIGIFSRCAGTCLKLQEQHHRRRYAQPKEFTMLRCCCSGYRHRSRPRRRGSGSVSSASSVTGCHPTVTDLKDPSILAGLLDLTRDIQQYRTIQEHPRRYHSPACIASHNCNLISRYPRHWRVQHNGFIRL
jgi:hypothetical protein